MPIVVERLAGQFKQDSDIFGKMDPYLVVTVGNTTLKTSVKHEGGKTPVWTDTLTFNEKGGILKIVAMDDDVGADDNLGEGTYDISPAYNFVNKPGTFDVIIMSKGKEVGKVTATVTYRV